ncbi:unnamed protein product [Lactuca saligna]|uniref:WRKY domain-containing protein n=1 Tax=Lactuca saligna TaxID=75948 RepID=A0AA35YG41_LACSI|nr:unnamed protein product [Lactuca saligna]
MEVKEAKRTIIAKPIASRPTISNFGSFSDILPGAINISPSTEPTVTAIRPKTVRFKPVMSSPNVKILKSDHASPFLYKPLAKTVSRTTISLLANMGTCNTSHEQAATQNLESMNPPKLKSDDKRLQSHTNNSDRPSYDGYNWRKYGQKQVKGSEFPRSYYKCTHPNCVVKKKVERSINGEIAETVYKGEHNHTKPRLPRRHAFDGTIKDSSSQLPSNQLKNDNKLNEVVGSSSRLTNLVKVHEEFDASCMPTLDDEHEPITVKRRKIINERYGEGLKEGGVVVHDGIDSEAIADGFRWRKYGQKVVKGNPYPRSYYRCTGVKCDVRKHVERASDDPNVFITTYEGKHNHEMPMKKLN